MTLSKGGSHFLVVNPSSHSQNHLLFIFLYLYFEFAFVFLYLPNLNLTWWHYPGEVQTSKLSIHHLILKTIFYYFFWICILYLHLCFWICQIWIWLGDITQERFKLQICQFITSFSKSSFLAFLREEIDHRNQFLRSLLWQNNHKISDYSPIHQKGSLLIPSFLALCILEYDGEDLIRYCG